jgi:hypothetical protein
MSAAYSAIVRSLENLPEQATLSQAPSALALAEPTDSRASIPLARYVSSSCQLTAAEPRPACWARSHARVKCCYWSCELRLRSLLII